MDRATLMIALMLFAVVAVGLLTVVDLTPVTPTGLVVYAERTMDVDDCSACAGKPVCAGKDAIATNYPSACAARCDGATILSSGICERLQRAY